MRQQNTWLFETPPAQINGWLGETEWELETSTTARRTCPTSASTTTLRCRTPKACPAIPNLLCVQAVNGVPFEYVDAVRKDPGTNLIVVSKRLRPRTQRFLPSVETALSTFINNMAQFGLPIEAILTLGSYLCRCISNTNTLSNHSFGDAIDIAGLRWQQPTSSSPGRETIVHNFRNPRERAVLRRINACLRLSFTTVIDYHRSDHRDHFHCDLNRGRPRNPLQKTTLFFVQEALNTLFNTNIPENGEFSPLTRKFLMEFARGAGGGILTEQALRNREVLNRLFDRLFMIVAATPL